MASEREAAFLTVWRPVPEHPLRNGRDGPWWLSVLRDLLGGLAFAWACQGHFMVLPMAKGQPANEARVLAVMPGARAPSTVRPPQEEVAGLKQEALEVARRVAEAYPQDALSYALLGSAYYNTGRSEEATKNLRQCLERNPNLAEAYEILARIAFAKGNLEETIRLCHESLKRDSENPEVLNQLGRALMDLGRTAEAIQTLQQAVRLPRPISQSSYLLGQALLQSGNNAQAKESFQRAIALLPDHTQAFFGLYTACLRLGQTEEASRYREQFQKLEAIDRQSLTERSAQEDTLTGLPMVRQTVGRTFFGAAQLYRAHEQATQAGELFFRAASLDGENAIYRSTLEAFYVQGKELAAGVTAFQRLASQQPDNPLNFLFLGRLEARLEHFEPAEQAYLKVQQLAPRWSEGYRALADFYIRNNRKLPEARQMAQRLVELAPSGPHYYLLAVACANSGDRQAALGAAKQAAARNPGEKRYQQLLQQLGN